MKVFGRLLLYVGPPNLLVLGVLTNNSDGGPCMLLPPISQHLEGKTLKSSWEFLIQEVRYTGVSYIEVYLFPVMAILLNVQRLLRNSAKQGFLACRTQQADLFRS